MQDTPLTSGIRLYSIHSIQHNVLKVIDFPRYNMKCSGGNEVLCEIFRVVFGFSLHFMLYRGNLDYFLDRAAKWAKKNKLLKNEHNNLPH